jgi:hypothetical protein
MSACIFCFRDNSKISFSKEHIIPHSVGGELILHDCVCIECNSTFGADIDHEILKQAEIIAAIERSKLPYQRAQLLNQNFKIRGISGDVEVKARATEDGFEFSPQAMPDGSVIFPESDYKVPLLRSILRDERLHDAGLAQEEAKTEYVKLVETYDDAEVGQKIEWPALGRTLVKRSESMSIKLEPKGTGEISRLIAKIAYEFGFFVSGREFLLNQRVAQLLKKFVFTGEVQTGLSIMRTDTAVEEYAPFHYISFQMYDSFTKFVVGFFGSIAYMLIAPPLQRGIFRHITDTSIIGVEYQQDLEKRTLGFWALLPDGENQYIGPKGSA